MLNDIATRFQESGLTPGGTVLIHSSISRTLRETGATPEQVIDALLDVVGGDGTLLFPLFNFEFTEGVAFDISSTPSHMGALSEAARLRPGAIRTGHPIYSFAVIGSQAEKFRGVCNRSAYGPDSPFAMLWELDGQIAVIDLPDQHSMTFYHHVEEMLEVPYRYHKDFTADYTGHDGVLAQKTFSIFVRDLQNRVQTSVDRMGERLWSDGHYKGQRPGMGNGLRVINAGVLFEEVRNVIEQGQAKEFLYEIESQRD